MSSGAGLSKARRKLGTVSRSLRLTRKGTLASSSGLKEAVGEIRGATSKMRDLKTPLTVGAVDIKKLIDDSFAHERDPGGTPWEELSEDYEWAKALNLVLGKHRGRKQKVLAKRSRGTIKRKRTRAEKAADTQKRHSQMTRKQSERAAKLAGNMKILVDTGRLRNSWFARAGKTSITFGTNTAYGKYHQAGGDVIPKRAMAPVEFINGQWKLINRGPAKVVLDRIGRSIMDYVAPEVD